MATLVKVKRESLQTRPCIVYYNNRIATTLHQQLIASTSSFPTDIPDTRPSPDPNRALVTAMCISDFHRLVIRTPLLAYIAVLDYCGLY